MNSEKPMRVKAQRVRGVPRFFNSVDGRIWMSMDYSETPGNGNEPGGFIAHSKLDVTESGVTEAVAVHAKSNKPARAPRGAKA